MKIFNDKRILQHCEQLFISSLLMKTEKKSDEKWRHSSQMDIARAQKLGLAKLLGSDALEK